MMIPVLLAGINGINARNSLRALIPSGSTVSQFLIYFGALFLVGLGLFAWAILYHRQRQRRQPRHHRRSRSVGQASRQSEVLPTHRTLAEAGGLPPVRGDKQSPPLA